MVVLSLGQVERERKRRDLDKQMLKENQKPSIKMEVKCPDIKSFEMI